MKKLILIFMAFAMLFALSAHSFGQRPLYEHRHHPTRKSQISHRQTLQQRRIANGISSGQLTNGETLRLERREGRINRTKRRFAKSGGHISKRENRILNRRLNRLSHSIYKKKHNKRVQ
jgi:hypothetical protein